MSALFGSNALSIRRRVPGHIVNTKCCGDVSFGESITSTDRQECGVRPVVVALRRTLGRIARDDVARDMASSGLQLPRAFSCWLRLVPPSE
jgi:hypothetical protein